MASIESDVRAMLDRQVEAMRRKDIDRLMAVYARDVVYFDVVAPLRFDGADALRARFTRWFDGYRGEIAMEMRDLHIVTRGELAVAFWLSRSSGTLTDGRQVGAWVRATSCCLQSAGAWAIVHEHISLPVDLQTGIAARDLVP
jgi:ketosteroid isomerase-like protein